MKGQLDKQAFRRALWERGGATRVADELGVSRQAIYKWMDSGRVPESRLPAVRRVLGSHWEPSA